MIMDTGRTTDMATFMCPTIASMLLRRIIQNIKLYSLAVRGRIDCESFQHYVDIIHNVSEFRKVI